MNSSIFKDVHVLIKGAGDLASGVAARLWRCGFPIVMTELAQPLVVRRSVAFAEAIYENQVEVEGILALRASKAEQIQAAWDQRAIPVIVDPDGDMLVGISPRVVVDGRLAKRNLSTRIDEAPLVIGLGPGFQAGLDVHAVIETNRGHFLGRVLWNGNAQPDTGQPGLVNGYGRERVIYAPVEGTFSAGLPIGSRLAQGDMVGMIGETPVIASLSGVLRGLVHDGLPVQPGMKVGDIDPRGVVEYCCTISEKALAIGGGVLEAILTHLNQNS
jgi:xanthine dehydrogenase accessory factor